MDIQYQQLLTIIIAPTAERLHVDTICFSFFAFDIIVLSERLRMC